MEIELKNTLEKHLKSGVNLFTGAGFSTYAESQGLNLPVGDALKNEIIAKFPSIPRTLGLPQLCTLLSATKKNELNDFLRKRFCVTKYDICYNNLMNVEIKNIFTTNIDNLIQNIFKDSRKKYINDVNFNGASIAERNAIDLYYLHGSISDTSSDLIFGDLDIASAISREPTRWTYLRKVMSTYPTIFWGYSLKDAGTLQTLAQALNDHTLNQAWIIVHPEYIEEGEIDYYKSLGLKIIKADTKEFLIYLNSLHSENYEITNLEKNIFPEYSIPPNASVNHRAIQDFYQGATPTWSDIYSHLVIRTRYFDILTNSLDGGKNVLITGGAATGKSTLLMQAASLYQFNGYKFYIKDISKEKATAIVNALPNTPVIFFIDDCQSSLEALNILSSNKNFRYVIAERDYAYLSSSNHAFFSKKIEFIDITEISSSDASAIYNNIPYDIKRIPYSSYVDNDSLFEFIEKNCKSPNIKDRFKNVISQLTLIDIKLVELFLLVCYMHRSRSVASMDIILSYFGNRINSHTDAYELIKTLGSSIREYTGDLVEETQDYFNIRSNMLADLISELAPVRNLNTMLTNFHQNVSRYSIPNYDTFKRKAYDAMIFEKAFPIIEDGIKIYDVIYNKHSSPFNLQQKALYLSRRKRHDKAFPVIDEAVAIAGSRNWSIKNSYAIIKFRANIDRDDNYETRKALDESMYLLEQCYSSDNRKTFHAMTYTDHALQYWHKYRDEESRQYLLKAKKWLEDELKSVRKVHNVYRLLRNCSEALNTFE